MKTLKEKLVQKEVTIGSWITLADTNVAEIMAKVGFDWLTIDIEHSSISIQQTQQLFSIYLPNMITNDGLLPVDLRRWPSGRLSKSSS